MLNKSTIKTTTKLVCHNNSMPLETIFLFKGSLLATLNKVVDNKVRYFFIIVMIFFTVCRVVAADFNVTVVDKNNQPLSDMVVYFKPLGDVKLPLSDKVVEIGQLNRAFTPYINVIQLGNTVNFRNKDDITHHIYSPVGDNKFSFKIRAGQSKDKNDFQQLGEVAMGCNIHDWMSGYLYIVDTPLFGKTTTDGTISMVMTHKGKYQLTVWHPQLETEGHSVSQLIEWPKMNEMIIKIPYNIGQAAEQKNVEDFDFLSDY